MAISSKECLAKPHPGQGPMKFFVHFLAFCKGWGGEGPAICLQ